MVFDLSFSSYAFFCSFMVLLFYGLTESLVIVTGTGIPTGMNSPVGDGDGEKSCPDGRGGDGDG
jgi:hypothetical protein